jgi:CrcB protein
MSPLAVLLVGLGSALGGIVRFAITWWATERVSTEFGAVIATLVINVLGSFAIGLTFAFQDREVVRHFVMVGVLGGFTTFSAFSFQTVNLMRERPGVAAAYAVASLVLCIVGAWLGCLASAALRPDR